MILPFSRTPPPLAIPSYVDTRPPKRCAWRALMAAVKVVLPWSMWPMVPTLTCGLVRANTSFAMLPPSSRPARPSSGEQADVAAPPPGGRGRERRDRGREKRVRVVLVYPPGFVPAKGAERGGGGDPGGGGLPLPPPPFFFSGVYRPAGFCEPPLNEAGEGRRSGRDALK